MPLPAAGATAKDIGGLGAPQTAGIHTTISVYKTVKSGLTFVKSNVCFDA
jgi:hypothetical protein